MICGGPDFHGKVEMVREDCGAFTEAIDQVSQRMTRGVSGQDAALKAAVRSELVLALGDATHEPLLETA